MNTRFETRRQDLLNAAVCSLTITAETLHQLDEFLEPFAEQLAEPEQRTHTTEYVQGLLSSLESKSGEGIAYLHDHNR
jgi:hypothetical protein